MLDTKTILERIKSIKDIHKCFNISKVGEINYDDYSCPILAIDPCEKANRSVLVTAGIHGNEPAGILAATELLKILVSEPTSTGYTVIPCINPWGSDHDSRANGIDRDINRDFRNPRTQEASAIVRYLSGRAFDLVLDLHEDPCHSRGYYLYCLSNSHTVFQKAAKAVHRIRDLGCPLESRIKIWPFSTRNGIVRIPYWASHITKLVDCMAFCNYCRTEGISENVVVTETPTFVPLEERVALQLLSIETLAE